MNCIKCNAKLSKEDYVFMGYCEKCYSKYVDNEGKQCSKLNNKKVINKTEKQNKTLSQLINDYNLLKNKDIIEFKNIYNEKMKKELEIHYNLKYWFFYALIVVLMSLLIQTGMGANDSKTFFIILFIMLVIPYIIYIFYQRLKIKLIKEEQEEAITNYKQVLKKFNINSPEDYVIKNENLMNSIINKYNKLKKELNMTCTDYLCIFNNSNNMTTIDFSLENEILKIYKILSPFEIEHKFKESYIISNGYYNSTENIEKCEYGYDFRLKNDCLNEKDFIQEFMSINLKDILHFNKIGTIHKNSVVSGGGGTVGGSSLSGAIVGGFIAGSTGAIIGSRKEGHINSIKTNIETTDTRKTLLKLKNKELLFNISTYTVLLKLIPNKDYESQIINKTDKETRENTDFIVKIEKLKNLLDTGALTKEEFEIQKKKILTN